MKIAPGAMRVGLGLVLLIGGGAPASPAAAAGKGAAASGNPSAKPAASAAPQAEGVVASIANRSITMDQLMQPLLEAHGLTVLLNLVQLELAKDLAQQRNIPVTEEDFAAERKQTLDRLFKESDEKQQEKIDAALRKNKPEEAAQLRKDLDRDHEQLFAQFLQNQRVTAPEFELVLKTNTYLRKLVEPQIDAAITDKELRQSFEAEYGASVRVRHIQANTAADLGVALARIRPKENGEPGEPFDKVARAMSKNPTTAGLGGELPRFSLATAGLPENFKLAAFALQVGEVSSIIEAEGAFHIIKLEEKFPPKAVKFENVKESVRLNLKDRAIQAAVKQARNQLAEKARNDLKVSQPVLAAQFAAKLAERDKQIQDEKEARRQMEKDRDREREADRSAPAVPSSDLPAVPTPPPPTTGTEPAPAPAPTPAPAAPQPSPGNGGGKLLSSPDDGRIKPSIVVPVPGRSVPAAVGAASDPARATEPAQQGTQSAPAGK